MLLIEEDAVLQKLPNHAKSQVIGHLAIPARHYGRQAEATGRALDAVVLDYLPSNGIFLLYEEPSALLKPSEAGHADKVAVHGGFH